MSPNNENESLFLVKSTTPCRKLADSLFLKYKNGVHEQKDFAVQAVGASAVNQAVKAIIIFNKKLVATGEVVIASVVPRFISIDKGEETVNVVELILKFNKIY